MMSYSKNWSKIFLYKASLAMKIAGPSGCRSFQLVSEMDIVRMLIFNHEAWITCCEQEYDARAWVRCPICDKPACGLK